MRNSVKAIFACCALVASCGKNGLEQRGRYSFGSIAVNGDAAATQAILAERTRSLGPIAAVFVNGVALPTDRVGVGHVVAIAPKPTDATAFGIVDTIVVDETGATAALDLALLGHGGVELPREVALGTHVVTRTNLATNGVARAAAGDFGLELLRREHAALLAPPTQGDAKVRIGLVHFRPDDPREARAAAEFVAAAKQRPWIELTVRTADGDFQRQNDAIAELRRDQHAVVVITDDPESIAMEKKARASSVPIVVLDPLVSRAVFCEVRADQRVLGRAAAEAIKRAAPNGGIVLELHGDLRDAVQQRHIGFLEGLAGS